MGDTTKNGTALSNRQRHDARKGIANMELPHNLRFVTNRINELRRGLENLVFERHGSVSLYHSSLINTACAYEKHRQLASHWLKVELTEAEAAGKPMKADTKILYSREAAAASKERDRAIERLGLNEEPDPYQQMLEAFAKKGDDDAT